MFHLYIASCVPDGGIYHYLYQDGELTLRDKTTIDRPMYLAIANGRMYGLLREPFADSSNSGVCSWQILDDGSLANQTDILTTGGRCGCHLTVMDQQVYVANYLSGSVSRLPDGAISTHSGHGVHTTRQEAPHVHFVGFTPDQKWLLAVDLGIDAICMYTPDLKTCRQVHVPAGHGCRHLAWSEDRKYCFCVNELASSVSVLRYEDDNLTLLDTVSILPEESREGNLAAAIRVVGERIYLSIRGCDKIVTLHHQQGHLSLPVFTDAKGQSPRDINIYEDLLFSTNENSDSVTVFRLESDVVRPMDLQLSVPKPLCVVFHEM